MDAGMNTVVESQHQASSPIQPAAGWTSQPAGITLSLHPGIYKSTTLKLKSRIVRPHRTQRIALSAKNSANMLFLLIG